MAGREETIDDETILKLIRDSDDPFLATSEVADLLGFSPQGTLKRLYSLEEDGYLRYKKAGNTNIWWLTDTGVKYLNSSESN